MNKLRTLNELNVITSSHITHNYGQNMRLFEFLPFLPSFYHFYPVEYHFYPSFYHGRVEIPFYQVETQPCIKVTFLLNGNFLYPLYLLPCLVWFQILKPFHSVRTPFHGLFHDSSLTGKAALSTIHGDGILELGDNKIYKKHT